MHPQFRRLNLCRALLLLSVATLACYAGGDDTAGATEAGTIRVDVGLVHVPVTVTGPPGNPITNLRRVDFRVFEEGTERTIQYFSAQDSPVSLGIIFDESGSMRPHLREARDAVARLIRSGMDGDEYFLIAFSDRPRLLVEPVYSPDYVLKKLERIRASGWTSLLDATHLGLATARRGRNNRKALILLSDGEDNRSRFTELEVRRQIRESEVSIYALGLAGDGQTDANLRLLKEIAEETGGRMLQVASLEDLPAAIEQISLSLRNQYLIGYSPITPYDGRYRKVTVQLTRPASEHLRASWRTGYYSPVPGLR